MPILGRAPKPNGHDGGLQRVLVVGFGSLLDDGIEGILQDVGSLYVVSMVYTNRSALVEAISKIQPDTIVLSQSEMLTATEIFELLDNAPAPAALRLVVVHLDSNTIDLYQKKCITATHRDDLVTMICSDN